MKENLKVVSLFFFCFLTISFDLDSQSIISDTTLANQYFDLAKKNENSSKYDSAIFYAEKAQVLYIKYLGEKSLKNANILYLLGKLCWRDAKYELALEYYFKALQIRLEVLGEKHTDVAMSYHYIGVVYHIKVNLIRHWNIIILPYN